MTKFGSCIILVFCSFLAACADKRESMEVVATAYSSEVQQTNSQPNLAAWGDILKPGTKAIAVSRDLLTLGLNYGTEVEIEGLSGTWIVMDKMHARWENRVDIYMGMDSDAAREWGKKRVLIQWNPE
jgi:3D (Asp-Asp-Asp) domain-containing protein